MPILPITFRFFNKSIIFLYLKLAYVIQPAYLLILMEFLFVFEVSTIMAGVRIVANFS
jgi:hypothetical protein